MSDEILSNTPYLKDQYRAFRYGQDWILVQDNFHDHFVLAPLSWLTPNGIHYAQEGSYEWANKSPDLWRLKAQTHWDLVNPNQLEKRCYGLGFNHEEYMDYHNRGALKGIIGLVESGYLAAKSIQEVNINDYNYSDVFSGFLSHWYKGKIVVETSKAIDRDRLSRYW
ncbi:MAG: hypothetical protein K8L97_18715 [Anaerolineae bacterium]|nr:hypothetical protein [Anaerolineae bacterium]